MSRYLTHDNRNVEELVDWSEARIEALERRVRQLERLFRRALGSGPRPRCGHECRTSADYCCRCARAFEERFAPREFPVTDLCEICGRPS